MLRAKLLSVVFCFSLGPQISNAHGFNANFVDIVKTFGGKYRVVIKYTHVELGEYREAFVDFEKKDEAIKIFQDLARGADFFWVTSRIRFTFIILQKKQQPF